MLLHILKPILNNAPNATTIRNHRNAQCILKRPVGDDADTSASAQLMFSVHVLLSTDSRSSRASTTVAGKEERELVKAVLKRAALCIFLWYSGKSRHDCLAGALLRRRLKEFPLGCHLLASYSARTPPSAPDLRVAVRAEAVASASRTRGAIASATASAVFGVDRPVPANGISAQRRGALDRRKLLHSARVVRGHRMRTTVIPSARRIWMAFSLRRTFLVIGTLKPSSDRQIASGFVAPRGEASRLRGVVAVAAAPAPHPPDAARGYVSAVE